MFALHGKIIKIKKVTENFRKSLQKCLWNSSFFVKSQSSSFQHQCESLVLHRQLLKNVSIFQEQRASNQTFFTIVCKYVLLKEMIEDLVSISNH